MIRKSPIPLLFLLPVLAALFVAAWGGGLGVLFMVVAETSFHEWAVVTIGILLVFVVPIAAALLSNALEKPQKERKL